MPRCGWLGTDAGRPYCQHGPAIKNGPKWKCRDANRRARRRYRASDKGREHRRRENATPHAKSSKQVYQLTRVPAFGPRMS